MKKLPWAKLMLIGTGILIASFVQSMMAFTGIIQVQPLMGEGFFLMALVFAVVLARRFAQTHTNLEISNNENLELNRTLEDKVRLRTEELKEKNDLITDSIEYASIIQRSMLPDPDKLRPFFSDSLILWKPRDIVGGDSYWFAEKDGDFFLAVLDCTGHGVPGALLAMTAASTLESLVRYSTDGDPAALLEELDSSMSKRLHQDRRNEVTDDGLEIGFCRYDSRRRVLAYAGSRLSLFVNQDGQIQEIPGDRRGVGYSRNTTSRGFTRHEIPVNPTTRFYLSSDGITDQNGGPKGFGFGKKRLLELVRQNGHLDMASQKTAIEAALATWQGNEAQRDDLSLVGFQIAFNQTEGA
jgi:serine phosphatase RsbU (regulator of sigma subunit)